MIRLKQSCVRGIIDVDIVITVLNPQILYYYQVNDDSVQSTLILGYDTYRFKSHDILAINVGKQTWEGFLILMDDIVFIIKTFEREKCIRRLVRSIFRKYPDAHILIGDDSANTCKKYFEKRYPAGGVQVFELPKDSGLSYGRNFLLDHVDTEYFVLLDDDFVFDKLTDIESGLLLLKQNNLDIIGGYFRNYPIVYGFCDYLKLLLKSAIQLEIPSNYIGHLYFDRQNGFLFANYITNEFPEYLITDITHNFFIGKTKVIREKNRWDNELKLYEHTAFFVQGKQNGLRVGFTNKMSVKHMPIRNKLYKAYRDRDYFQLYMKKNGIKKAIITYNGTAEKTIDCII